MNKGYSFIELLVVITMIAILGTITTEAFILGIRAQAKSETLKEVKQNADYMGQVIEQMIRNSAEIEESQCNINNQQLTLESLDGTLTTFDCSEQFMASNSGEFPEPTIGAKISSNRVKVETCNFRVICPTPPTSPKYVYLNFTVAQAGSDELPIEKKAWIEYQNTVSLRRYE